jgi:hypothetical protein
MSCLSHWRRLERWSWWGNAFVHAVPLSAMISRRGGTDCCSREYVACFLLIREPSFTTGLRSWNRNDRDGFVDDLVVWPFCSVRGQESPEFDLPLNLSAHFLEFRCIFIAETTRSIYCPPTGSDKGIPARRNWIRSSQMKVNVGDIAFVASQRLTENLWRQWNREAWLQSLEKGRHLRSGHWLPIAWSDTCLRSTWFYWDTGQHSLELWEFHQNRGRVQTTQIEWKIVNGLPSVLAVWQINSAIKNEGRMIEVIVRDKVKQQHELHKYQPVLVATGRHRSDVR